MRRGVVLAGLAVLGVLLAGCPPTYPNCSSDDQCKEHGEVCVQGKCQECATDANCKEGFVCQGNRCVPKPECTPTGNECGPGRRCEDGRCVTAQREMPGRCTTDEDCPSGQTCQAGQCAAGARAGGAECSFEPIHHDDLRGALRRHCVPVGAAGEHELRRLREQGHLSHWRNSTRRLAAQACSLCPSTAGRVFPYPIVWSRCAFTPRVTR